MTTYADIIARARIILQDRDAERYDEASMLAALNQAQAEVYSLRPDFWVGNYSSGLVEIASADLGNTVARIPIHAYTELTMMTAGFAELQDDEHVTEGRALGIIQAAQAGLRGR